MPNGDRNPIRPAVIVGIGGVGKEVLMRIRRMIVENYGRLANLPIVQFLHVDTHTDLSSATPSVVLGEDITFKVDERVELSKQIQERVGANIENVRNDRRIRDWLYDNLNVNYDFATGAGGVRALGRLAFVYSVDVFREKLHTAAEKARNPNSVHVTQTTLGLQPVDGLDVYIVCSLFGGTGSGCFLEVAYNTREHLQQLSPTVLGFLVIGGNRVDTVMKANCYGALKELEYFSSSALDGTLNPFDMEYPIPGIPRLTTRQFPFDVCYLVNWINEGGRAFSKEQLEENVARNIFLEFSPGISDAKRGKRIDILATGGRDKLEGKQGRFQGFFTFGLSILEFPAIRIRDTLAHSLASHATKLWLFDQAPGIQDLPGEVRTLIRNNGLIENDLINSLLMVGGEDLRTTSERDLRAQKNEIDTLIDRPDFDMNLIRNSVEGNIRRNMALVNFDYDPQRCGGYVAAIQENKREKLRKVTQSLKEHIAAMVGNPYQGSKNALLLINGLINSLQVTANNLHRQLEAYTRSSREAQRAVTERFDRFIRDLNPKYRNELKYHNSKLVEVQGNFLRTALKREAYRFAYQLVNEDVMADGKPELCLISELKNLREKVETYRERLENLSKDFDQIWRDKEANILNTPIATGVNITQEKLQSIAREIVPNLEQESHRLLSDVQNELGEKDAAGNVIRPKPIFLAITEDFDQTKRVIIQAAQRRCENTRQYSIAGELANNANLSQIIRHNLVQATVMAQTSGLNDQTDHLPERHHYRWIGTCNPEVDPAVEIILRYVPQEYLRVRSLPDKYQIIFVEEKGIFPLRCLPFLQEYESHYKNLLRGRDPIPRETDKRIQFRDLFPPDPRIAQIYARAEKAALLGKVFELLHEAEDPSTRYQAIYLSYYDERNRDMFHRRISDSWDALEKELAECQIAKEIEQQSAFDEQTSLEILEAEIHRIGTRAQTRVDREELWVRTQEYLIRLRNQLEGGDLHPEYQRQRGILQEFRDKYGLRAPKEQSKDRQEKKEEEELRAPKEQVQEVKKEERAESIPIAEVRIPADSKYERIYRDYVRKRIEQIPVLDEQAKESLLKYGTVFCRLPQQTAQKILEEEIEQNKGTNIEARIDRYRQLFMLAIEDGQIEPEERERLKEAQYELGLSDDIVRSIEYPFTSELYRQFFLHAVEDKIIDRTERQVLKEHQRVLGLTDEQVREIESEFVFEEQEGGAADGQAMGM